MLSRPEIGTRADILLWLAGKPADETYLWEFSRECACGQYARERMGRETWSDIPVLADPGAVGPWGNNLNNLAHEEPHTFGALYERACKAWADEAVAA